MAILIYGRKYCICISKVTKFKANNNVTDASFSRAKTVFA